MDRYTEIFKALADRTRLRLLSMLIYAGRELCICELVEALGLAQYNVSRHMKELKLAGLVAERREGRFVYFAPLPRKDEFGRKLFAALRTLCCAIDREDCRRLKKFISRPHAGRQRQAQLN